MRVADIICVCRVSLLVCVYLLFNIPHLRIGSKADGHAPKRSIKQWFRDFFVEVCLPTTGGCGFGFVCVSVWCGTTTLNSSPHPPTSLM
mmetsp:Transcript_26733/g.76706  ORF Transcript_26733/g.76706 Transcript_26733/m.76706 type:complete len:89 (+) Transcript_26733:281-547(+)